MKVNRACGVQEDTTAVILERGEIQKLSNEGCVSITTQKPEGPTSMTEEISVHTNPLLLPDTLNNISNVETDSERKFEDALTALQHSIQLINHLTEDRVLEKPKRKELDTLINTYQFYENVRNNYE